MYSLPSRRRAVLLLEEAGCSPNLIEHCKVVSRLATGIAKRLRQNGVPINVKLVAVGGLLHDIGRSRTHGVGHGVEGGKIGHSAGLLEPLIRIIERHIGAGITADEAQKLGLPGVDYLPQTLEEKVVAYADKLVEGRGYVSFEAALERFKRDLGATHPAVDRLRRLHEEISILTGDAL